MESWKECRSCTIWMKTSLLPQESWKKTCLVILYLAPQIALHSVEESTGICSSWRELFQIWSYLSWSAQLRCRLSGTHLTSGEESQSTIFGGENRSDQPDLSTLNAEHNSTRHLSCHKWRQHDKLQTMTKKKQGTLESDDRYYGIHEVIEKQGKKAMRELGTEIYSKAIKNWTWSCDNHIPSNNLISEIPESGNTGTPQSQDFKLWWRSAEPPHGIGT